MAIAVLIVLLLLAATWAIVRLSNRALFPAYGPLRMHGPAPTVQATKELSVLTWNVGFAGLGKDADFFSDGGTSTRPLSAAQITAAADQIARRIAVQDADITLLQENARPGFLNRRVPVSDIIDAALPMHQSVFWSDMRAIMAPPMLDLDHGMSVHCRVASDQTRAIALPQDDTYYFGMIKKHYGGIVTRLPIAGSDRCWVIYNIHLSAFDAGGATRRDQLRRLLDRAARDFDAGHHVVIGGDWNLRLCALTTGPAPDPSWLIDLPADAIPAGWHLAVDARVPTVRGLDAPFVPGQTRTAIIDGFVVSPNVAVSAVSTTDLGFDATDHHPVMGRFRAV